MSAKLYVPVHSLAQRALDFGGFTYRLSDGTFPKRGFAVAVSKGPERQLDHAPTPADIQAFALDNDEVIEAGNIVFRGGVCLGCWDAAGIWYLDLRIVCPSLDEALVLGRQNRQMAVFDLDSGTPVAIPWTGVDDPRHLEV